MTPWEVLGVDPEERDEAVLRRAYAAKLREHRPDEDPAGFQRVREAYERVLAMVRYEDEDDDFEDDDPEFEEPPPPPVRETRVRERELVDGDAAPVVAPEDPVAAFFAGDVGPLLDDFEAWRAEGDVKSLRRLARTLHKRAEREGLPPEGAWLAVSLATVAVPLEGRAARGLVDRAYAAASEARGMWLFDQFGTVDAAAKELAGHSLEAREAMARLLATGETEGAGAGMWLARSARATPDDGAFRAWLKEAAPELRITANVPAASEPETSPWWNKVVIVVAVVWGIVRLASNFSNDEPKYDPPPEFERDLDELLEGDEFLKKLRDRYRKRGEPLPDWLK